MDKLELLKQKREEALEKFAEESRDYIEEYRWQEDAEGETPVSEWSNEELADEFSDWEQATDDGSRQFYLLGILQGLDSAISLLEAE